MDHHTRLKSYLIVLIVSLLLLTIFPTITMTQSDEVTTHVVQAGENLFRIALRYGISTNELADANGISDTSRIYAGQVLVIPGVGSPDSGDIIENPLIAGTPTIHIVQPGETLSAIAQSYGLTVEQIMQINEISDPNRIERYQELTVWTTNSVTSVVVEDDALPEEFVSGASSVASVSYTVQAGESLSQIARRYGLSWTTLAQINNILNPDTLYAGQVITIPGIDENGGIIDMGIISPLTPISADIPSPTITVGRQVVVDLSTQMTYAYEDGVLLYSSLVSTGLPATPTVIGDFQVWHRTRSQTMTGPGYSLDNVEFVQYFYQGYGLHGTYWHNNFGQPMSHGCVNMTNPDAEWFYNFGYIGLPVHVQY